MTEQMNRLENQLQNLIAEHSAWLSGDDWQAACEAVGRGMFAELAESGELADRFAEALTEALAG